MSSSFLCEIVTPETLIFSEEISFISAPAAEGEIGILYKRAPVMSSLNLGEVRVKRQQDGESLSFAVSGGYMEAVGTKVVILASRAQELGKLSLDEVRTAKDGADKKLASLAKDDSQGAYYRDELAWYTLLERLLLKK
jgi:F-type H+-transporting ATPase subunit epsilon